jgi:hypothetical protein
MANGYCRAAVASNNKVKPHVIVVGGGEEKHEHGSYCVRNKNQWIDVGTILPRHCGGAPSSSRRTPSNMFRLPATKGNAASRGRHLFQSGVARRSCWNLVWSLERRAIRENLKPSQERSERHSGASKEAGLGLAR